MNKINIPRAQMMQSLFRQSLHPKYPKWLIGSTYLQCIAVLWQLCGWKTVQSWLENFLHIDMSVNSSHCVESILFVQSCSFRAQLRLCLVQAEPWALPSHQQGLAWLGLLGLGSQGLMAWSWALHITTPMSYQRKQTKMWTPGSSTQLPLQPLLETYSNIPWVGSIHCTYW